MIRELIRKLNAKRHASIKNTQKRLLMGTCKDTDISCDHLDEVVDNQKVTPNRIYN